MIRITTNELKDVALFSIAYSMLCYDADGDKYITNRITAELERLKSEMFEVIKIYKSESARVTRIIDRLMHITQANRDDFCITAPQLALNLLCLWLPANERKGKILCEPLVKFWAKNETLVREIINRTNDKEYKKQSEAAEKLAYVFIENL